MEDEDTDGREVFIVAYVKMEMPEEMVSYVMRQSQEERLRQNAMILYPYVHDGVISHGRAAEILGIFKMDLIVLYGRLGLPYLDMTDDEIEEELAVVKELGEALV